MRVLVLLAGVLASLASTPHRSTTPSSSSGQAQEYCTKSMGYPAVTTCSPTYYGCWQEKQAHEQAGRMMSPCNAR